MKVTLYNAISLDGFIARVDGSTDWVQDFVEWEQLVRRHGNMVIGRHTFKEIENELFAGVSHFILSSEGGINRYEVTFVQNIAKLMAEAAERDISELLLCGGSHTNATFAAENVIDELILDIHPLLLGEGKHLLGNYTNGLELKLLENKNYPKFVQQRYKVIKASR